MAWVRSEQSLRDHPKTKRAARALGLKSIHFCGHLHGLWWWALDYAQDGDVTKYEPWELAEAAEFDGDPAAFVEALVGAGFLERTTTQLVIHDWYDYAGVLIMQRQANAKRMRDKRAEHVQDTCAPRTGATNVTNVTNEEDARARSAPVDNSQRKGRKSTPEAIGNVMQTLAALGAIPGGKA